eukprot:scaffold165176_cov45-Tisochrysis_lutea.AAC.1
MPTSVVTRYGDSARRHVYAGLGVHMYPSRIDGEVWMGGGLVKEGVTKIRRYHMQVVSDAHALSESSVSGAAD